MKRFCKFRMQRNVAVSTAWASIGFVTLLFPLPVQANDGFQGDISSQLGSRVVTANTTLSEPDSIHQEPMTGAMVTAQAISLPRLVERSVRREAASRSSTQITPEQLQIVKYEAEIWPDGCLGLSRVDETCSQGLVSGWRVLVRDGVETWTYRTNASGQNTRLEPPALDSVGGLPYNPRPTGRNFIGDSSTSTSPLPEEQQLPSSQLRPRGGQIRITLTNRTNASLKYQVIGDTAQRQLLGQQSATLRLLDVPATVTFRRDDGGLLMVLTRIQRDAHSLHVFLDAAIDLSMDRTTLTVERNGEVFLN